MLDSGPFMFGSRVFLPFALGYFLSQLFRSVIAVVSADLIDEMALDASTLGFLTSVYFLAFAGAQLPIGVALDRFGPRRTEAALLLVAALGSLVFAAADDATGLGIGRGLIGLGVSACLMASFHAFVLWAPADRLPFLNGSVMAVGASGALAATVPVEWALTRYTWPELFQGLSLMTLVCAGYLFFTVPEKEHQHEVARLSDIVRGMAVIFKSKMFWSIAPFSVCHQGSYLAIQSLWAGPWLRDFAGLPRDTVAGHLLALATAMGVGFIGLGFLAQRLGRRGVSTLSVWISAAVVFQFSQLGLTLGWTRYALPLWIAFGLFGASGMLGYVILTRRFPIEMAGRVNTGLNVFVFSSAFAIQAGIGAVIQWLTPDGSEFSPHGFQVAFGVVLALQLIGLIWLAMTSSWRRATPGRLPVV